MPKEVKLPEPEKDLNFIDVHCHLPFPRPKKNDQLPSNDVQFGQYFEEGGLYLVTSTIDMNTLKLTLDFIKGRELMGFCCGWAPQTVTYTPSRKYYNEWEKWKEYITNNIQDYLAIGEIGLDFHHAKTLDKRENQVNELEKIFELTEDLEKPYVLHVRNAAPHEIDKEHPDHHFNKDDGATKEMLRILEKYRIKPDNVMWHCFSGPEIYGSLFSQQGYYLSVPSSAFGMKKWRKTTKNASIDSLLTETDSYYQHPYLRGPVNVPSNVKYSIVAIAHSHGISQKEVSNKTIDNAVKFFKLQIS
jgi:TatD DNase family protein